jgi:hypothetical protein
MNSEILYTFSNNIRLKVKTLLGLETQYQTSVIKSSIHSDIRKYSDLLIPLQSEAAFYQSEKLKIDLIKKNWHNQPSFDPGRKIFHFEHMIPVNQLTDMCIQNSKEIENILNTCTVVWILKSEDRILTELGFRNNRIDPIEAYKKANIIIKGMNHEAH